MVDIANLQHRISCVSQVATEFSQHADAAKQPLQFKCKRFFTADAVGRLFHMITVSEREMAVEIAVNESLGTYSMTLS